MTALMKSKSQKVDSDDVFHQDYDGFHEDLNETPMWKEARDFLIEYDPENNPGAVSLLDYYNSAVCTLITFFF
jgi:hypothetical protein